MEKQEKKFDLKSIMTKKSYNRLNNYLNKIDKSGEENTDYGKDAFALLGSSAKLGQVCQMFNLLADPEYINLRSDWGDITGQDNEVIPDIDDYATGVKNSFAIKKVADNFAHLDFPLFNNYMSVDSSIADIPLQTSWAEQKKLFQDSLGVKIIDNQEFDDFFDYAEKKGSDYVKFSGENSFKHTAAKVMHLPLKMLHKMFTVVKLEDKFPFKKQLAKDPNAKEKVCFVSKHFKDNDLSQLDKFIAVVDAFTYEKISPLLYEKEVWNDVKKFDEQTRRKILVASKLVADWAVCMASDLGNENHKQMDNALKLELNSILGTLPQNDRNITIAIANVSNDLTAKMFKDMKHLNYADIVEHRKEIGVEYVDEFDLKNFATWDAMKLTNPNAIDLNQVLFGRTINKSFEKTKDTVVFKGYSPAFNSLQPEAEVIEEYQPTPISQEPISVTPPTAQSNSSELSKVYDPESLFEPIENNDESKQIAPSQSESQDNIEDAELQQNSTADNKDRQTTLDEFPDEVITANVANNVVQDNETTKDEIVGKVIGFIIPAGITVDSIIEVDDKENKIVYKNNEGKVVESNLLAFDGSNYREFVDKQGFGKTLTVDENNVAVFEKNSKGQKQYFGSYVKLEDLSKYKIFVEKSKNTGMIHSPLMQDVISTAPISNNKSTSTILTKPNFGPVSLGYVVPVDVEAENIVVGTDYTGVPTIAILNKDGKVDKNGVPKYTICNSLLEENGTLRIAKRDDTFDSAISGDISIDEDLRIWRTLKNGKEDVVGYLIRPNEIEDFKQLVDNAIEKHKIEQDEKRINNACQRRAKQVTKNEEQRKIIESNLKIGKYLDKKPTVAPQSNIADVNMKKSKYGFKKSTAMMSPDYSNSNLKEASSQQEAKEYDIAKRNAQVEKNKTVAEIDEKNIELAKLLDKTLTDDPYTKKGLTGIKYLDKKPTEMAGSNIQDKNIKKMKYMDKKPTLSPASNIQDENMKLAKSLKINEKTKPVCPRYDSERLCDLCEYGVISKKDVQKTTREGLIVVKNKKEQAHTTTINGIIIHEKAKKQKTIGQPSLQEINPELMKNTAQRKVPKKPTRKEINPELFR